MNRKEELKREMKLHQDAITQEVESVKSTGKKFGLIALAAAGTFFLTYSIARGISAGKKSREEQYESDPDNGQRVVYQQAPPQKKSGFGKKVGGIIMTELAILLIGMAKYQLKNYLSKLDISNDEEDTE